MRLFRHLDQVTMMEAALDVGPQGLAVLRVAVNAGSLATWVIPALADTAGILFDLVNNEPCGNLGGQASEWGGRRASFPSHRLASSQGFVDACLMGVGWGLNPEPLIADHLAAGRLVEIAPDSPLDVDLHWQYARATALAIAPLTRAIVAEGTRVLI